MKTAKSNLIVACLAVFCLPGVISAVAADAQQRKDRLEANPEALANWRNLKFGLFIHWGPSSLKGARISMWRGRQIPIEVYDNLYRQFNPVKFNAKEWVAVAKAAGTKYLVITAKHHDGFCLFDSQYTDYDIMSTPFKRDVLKELSEECRRQGIQFSTYYSILDWYQADYLPRGAGDKRPTEGADLDRYVTYMKNQLRELVTKYGPLGVMWFDGEWDKTWTHERGLDLYRYVRSLQPNILINDRVDRDRDRLRDKSLAGRPKLGEYAGDFTTPEERIGEFDCDVAWETCDTIPREWSWKPNDVLKSRKECIQMLVKIVGGDGNLLLNVGPMPDGRIEPSQVERLKEMGRWLQMYGESIYGTRGGPFPRGNWGAATCKGDTIYIHILDPKLETVTLPPIEKKIVASSVLTGGTATVKQTQQSITVAVPENDRQEIDTIVVLKLAGVK